VYLFAGLGLSAVFDVLFDHLRGPRWLYQPVMFVILLSALVLMGYQSRNVLHRADFHAQAAAWQEVGERLGMGASVVVLSEDYGTGLSYWGWIQPVHWPTAADLRFRAETGQSSTFEERFAALAEGRSYFVISPPAELDTQPELAAYLQAHYLQLVEQPTYQIYDLRTSLP
jgi:hypothetical protein